MTEVGQKVSFKDIREGDTIRYTREFKVREVAGTYLDTDSGATLTASFFDKGDVEIVDRPIPPLPTEFGSLIEVKGSRWFLRESEAFVTGMWQGTGGRGDAFSNFSMDAYVKSAGGFTVIA